MGGTVPVQWEVSNKRSYGRAVAVVDIVSRFVAAVVADSWSHIHHYHTHPPRCAVSRAREETAVAGGRGSFLPLFLLILVRDNFACDAGGGVGGTVSAVMTGSHKK